MPDEIIGKSALFFFLLTFNDRIATDATVKIIEVIKNRSSRRTGASSVEDTNLECMIECCMEHWQTLHTRFSKEKVQIVSSKLLQWPEHIDLNPWKEFQKRAPENELIAVTWVHVLGIPEQILARALKVSEGTIRYRVGKGLSLLGQLNRPNISSLQFT
jgi:hypothetical protein